MYIYTKYILYTNTYIATGKTMRLSTYRTYRSTGTSWHIRNRATNITGRNRDGSFPANSYSTALGRLASFARQLLKRTTHLKRKKTGASAARRLKFRRLTF